MHKDGEKTAKKENCGKCRNNRRFFVQKQQKKSFSKNKLDFYNHPSNSKLNLHIARII